MRRVLLLIILLFPLISSAQVPDTVKPKVRDSLNFWKDTLQPNEFWKDSVRKQERERVLRDGQVNRPPKPAPRRKKFKYRFSDRIQYSLLLDWPMTSGAGVPTSLLPQKKISDVEERIFTRNFELDSTQAQRRRSFFYRAGKLVFVDAPLQTIVLAAEQDLFGSMARTREFCLSASYKVNPIHLFSFWKPFGQMDYDRPVVESEASRQQLSQIAGASLEASSMASDQLALRWMQRKSVFYYEALHNLRIQMALIGSALTASSDAVPGKTAVEDWLYYTNRQYGHYGSYGYKSSDLKRDVALATFTNPNFYTSLYSVFVNYLANGKDSMATPAIRLGYGQYALPWVRYGFTPLGPEWIPELTLTKNRGVLNIYGRIGTGIFTNSYGGGIRLNNFVRSDNFSINAQVAFWNQPYFFRNWVNQEVEAIGIGGMASVTGFFKLTKGKSHPLSLTVQAGYKTRGFTEGEVWQASPIIRVGLSFALDRDYEQDYTYIEYETVPQKSKGKKKSKKKSPVKKKPVTTPKKPAAR